MELLSKDGISEYEAFLESHPKGHFLQSTRWAGIKSAWDSEVIIARDGAGKIAGSMMVLIRKIPFFPFTMMYSPRGPVCDIHDGDMLGRLVLDARELAAKRKSYVLKLDPDVPSADSEFSAIMRNLGFDVKEDSKTFDAVQPRYVFRLNIAGRNEDEIMASFHSKTRYNIRVAEKNGVTVEIAGREAIADFSRIMTETGLRDNFVTRPQSYFESMYDNLGEHVRLYMANYEGAPVAGTLAVNFGNKVWYLYGASSNEHRNVMPNYLLQWEMIKWAIESGADIYDFRGVAGVLEPGHPLYGLYRFKKGFGGEFTEFTGEMNLVLDRRADAIVNLGEKVYKRLIKLRYRLKNR